MYADADAQIARIIALAEQCPDPYRARCFEILLQGYVDAAVATVARGAAPLGATGGGPGADGETERGDAVAGKVGAGNGAGADAAAAVGQVPAELRGRFQSTAKRLGVPPAALEGLFDLTADPLDYHALHVQGKDNADTTRKVALLVAARSYLLNGTWVADWAEVKAKCVDQNCYDKTNFASYLKKGSPASFKMVAPRDRIELNGTGVKEAQDLLAALASEGA